jgi:hypothetical protein
MAHVHTEAVRVTTEDARLSRRAARLFKADHPRDIDRYIDYFGGTLSDPCGERLLDAATGDDR